MIPVSVIVPNLNGGEMLLECIEALKQQSFKEFEVVLVDNGSTDGSQRRAAEIIPGLTLIQLEGNHGFAGACVKAWEQAQGEWIAVLNNDAKPEPGWIEEMLEAAKSDEKIGMVASRVLQEGEGQLIDSLGMLAGRNGLIYLIGHGEPEELYPDTPRFKQVFGPPAVAALYSREMLEEIGFFEQDFFAYYEDADLAFRARWAGWNCVLANKARVRHRHSETAKAIGLSKTYFLHKNRIRAFFRNWPLMSLIRNFPRMLLYDILTTLGAVYIDRNLDAFRARFSFAALATSDMRWRLGQRHLRRVPAGEIDRWLSSDYPPALEVFKRKSHEN